MLKESLSLNQTTSKALASSKSNTVTMKALHAQFLRRLNSKNASASMNQPTISKF
jgi:hypothetical protein